MNFDADGIVKLLAVFGGVLALFVGIPNSIKAWREMASILRAQRRIEHEFASRLGSKDPVIERYANELGYAALIGDRHLRHEQRKYLLSLPEAEQKSAAYMRSKELLVIEGSPICFMWRKSRFKSKIYRRLLKAIWWIGYFFSGVLIFLPSFWWTLNYTNTPMPASIWKLQFLSALTFLPVAGGCLVMAKRIADAEILMNVKMARSL